MNNAKVFLGAWRIVETELWDVEDLDLAEPARLALGADHQGDVRFIAIQAGVDYRVVVRDGLPAVEFSFQGFDEGDEVTGRGWAVLEGERLRGQLFFHQGDESSFLAERENMARSRRSPANKRLHPTAAGPAARRPRVNRSRYADDEMKLRNHILETLRLVEAQAPALVSSPPDPARQFAAAGLMRCCALLRGVCLLEDGGLGAIAGILERQHWETWLVSLHVVLRGDEALHEVAGDDIFWKRLLAERLDLKFAYHPDWAGKIAKLNFKELADELGPLLAKAGETGDCSGITGYDVTYRVQSLFTVHAGLATIGSYLRYGDTSWSVESNPAAPFGGLGLTPALHTLHLAKYVFEAFGIPVAALEPVWDSLITGARTEGSTPSN